MSVQNNVAETIDVLEEGVVSNVKIITEAVTEVSNFLAATSGSIGFICTSIETATDKQALRQGFRLLNECVRMIDEALPDGVDDHELLSALRSLPFSPRFIDLFDSNGNLAEVVSAYKTLLIRELASTIRRKEEMVRAAEEQDSELFDTWMPEAPEKAQSPAPDIDLFAGDKTQTNNVESMLGKRGLAAISSLLEGQKIPKKAKSSIPALATFSGLGDQKAPEGLSKKALMTRERLRKGVNDPKGLLELNGSSTNALERTKQLELLKSAGVDFNSQKGTFSEKVNAANLRLDLGLVGHTLGDTLLFGAKVLSSPRNLTRLNRSDVENNVVDGKTS